jgi:4-amino-4-deoxy-L-arabinose transferase-like glycosyltransferase
MQERKYIFGLSSVTLVIILGATLKFALHMYMAPGYGFFGDELYTIALSKHLAFGYVDLPPLVPALVALSRALLGDSLFAYHIFPALAGAATLVFVGLIAKEFGGKTFAVLLSVLGFIAGPLWLGINSVFCYDGFDQLVLAAFLYVLVRFLRSGNQRLWLLLGGIAGIACLTKMTILFLGPGFLAALLISKYRRDLLTPWPWLGAAICLVVVSPYLLEYWTSYGTSRVYEASLPEYLTNLLIYIGSFLLPLWLVGLYRIFRRLDSVDYSFLGLLLAITLVMMFMLHSSTRMLVELFMPILAAGAVFIEELSTRVRWGRWIRASVVGYLLIAGVLSVLTSLPILPIDSVKTIVYTLRPLNPPIKEFKGVTFYISPMLSGKLGWEELVQDVSEVYDELPPEEHAIAGIYTDWYSTAGAIDELGPKYGLPHAVSGVLTYYLWGPGYSWDVMIVVSSHLSSVNFFFDKCELKKTVTRFYDVPVGAPNIYLCRKPTATPDVIWTSMKVYR